MKYFLFGSKSVLYLQSMKTHQISFSKSPNSGLNSNMQNDVFGYNQAASKKREVNLSVGGIQAGRRVDYLNSGVQSTPKQPNYNYQYTYTQPPINYNNSQSISVAQQPPSYNNNQYLLNSQQSQSVNYNRNNQYYQSDNRKVKRNDNRNQMVLRSQHTEDLQTDQENSYGKKKKKGCKEKCCGLPLWILLGLLALAAIVLGLLFALGVLGGRHQPKADPSTTIDGVSYSSDSVSVQTVAISKNKVNSNTNTNTNTNTDYQFPTNNQIGVDPIPVYPSTYKQSYSVSPYSVAPVPSSHIRNYDDAVYPSSLVPAQNTISFNNNAGNTAIDPIKIDPTRGLNIIPNKKDIIDPIQWNLDQLHPGYFRAS